MLVLDMGTLTPCQRYLTFSSPQAIDSVGTASSTHSECAALEVYHTRQRHLCIVELPDDSRRITIHGNLSDLNLMGVGLKSVGP